MYIMYMYTVIHVLFWIYIHHVDDPCHPILVIINWENRERLPLSSSSSSSRSLSLSLSTSLVEYPVGVAIGEEDDDWIMQMIVFTILI